MKHLSRALRISRDSYLAGRWIALSIIGCAFIAALIWSHFSVRRAAAATPSTGTISTAGPGNPPTVTWTGNAAGGSSPNGESTCVDGTNCDTFRLTVAPGGYTGKQIATK